MLQDKIANRKGLLETGILPVIMIPEIDIALPLAKALLEGGINSLEVTLRSECALDALQLQKSSGV